MSKYMLYAILRDGRSFPIIEQDSLEEMDNITKFFDDANDFRDGMNEVHETKYDIVNLFLQRERNGITQRIPIVYSEDIFDVDDVIGKYYDFLLADLNRLKHSNVRHVNLPSMIEFKKSGRVMFSPSDLKLAVKVSFYRNGKPIYSKIREAYFELKDYGVKVRCKKR